ncbi:hypothetical protein ACI2OX_10765 [Bacillus sp. N9]
MRIGFPVSSFVAWIRSLGYEVHLPEELDFATAFQTMQRDKNQLAASHTSYF